MSFKQSWRPNNESSQIRYDVIQLYKWLLMPATGEFWFWLAGPVMLATDLSKAFSDKMVLIRKASEAKAVTKTKLMKMKAAQLELAEIQLDKELSQAKKDYQRYHGEKE